MPNKIPIHDTQRIDRLRGELRIEPRRLRRLRIDYFKKFRGKEAALEALPAEQQTTFTERVDFHPLLLDQRHDSQEDGASKLIFRTRGGYLIESVLLRAATGRVALCVSSQVGCAAKCDFCATGRMGMAHDLTPAEILDQLVQANEQLALDSETLDSETLDSETKQRTVRNLVFMGMGEPFHNEAALYETLTSLADPKTFHHPPSRILVSTVGIADAMLRCAGRFPSVNLALSLHSVRQATRESIIPLAKRYPLTELQKTLHQLIQKQRSSVMIEYLMLAGVNDSLEEAAELAEWVKGMNVHINLIPYNQVAEAPHLTGTPRPEREAFANVLKQAGLPTTLRYSMGQDIEAACGQLVRQENRAVAQAAAKERA